MATGYLELRAQEISANLAGKGYNDMFKLRCGYLLGSKTRRNPALPVDALCGFSEFPLGSRVAHFRLRPHLFQVAARCCALALPEQRAKEIAAPDAIHLPTSSEGAVIGSFQLCPARFDHRPMSSIEIPSLPCYPPQSSCDVSQGHGVTTSAASSTPFHLYATTLARGSALACRCIPIRGALKQERCRNSSRVRGSANKNR